MSLVISILSAILMSAGALLVLSGALGLLRFPDFYTRVHAAGVTDTAGAGLILIGLLLQADHWSVAVRLVIIMIFMALSSPTASHLLGQAARRDGVHVWRSGEERR